MLRKTLVHVRLFKVLAIFTICFSATYFVIRIFQIKTIEVVGDNIALRVNETTLSKNLLFFPSDKVAHEIMTENKLVASVLFRKKYPHTLVITVIRRNPIARLRSVTGDIALTQDGTVTDILGNYPDLPELIFSAPSTISPGDKIEDTQIRFALDILSQNSTGIIFKVFQTNDSESIRAELGNTTVLFSQKKPIRESLSTLQSLLAGFRIKGINPSRIDLRFEKTVII